MIATLHRADGATRPHDGQDAMDPGAAQKAVLWLTPQGVRGVSSGMRTSTSPNPLIGRIAPRPVLRVAAGGFEQGIPANRVYRDRGGPITELYELPEAGHTGGLRARPSEYERRTTGFLDRALGL